ncbi:DUF1844 domain-containing protein [Myxococcota bacterium]|jgi:hypothetical protein|nr:DUF1844 domain-containing protein [Myxococcota bacterium]
MSDVSPTDGSPREGKAELQVSFASFLVSLGRTALEHLGDMPETESRADLDLARQTIDLLAILQDKTKGNLDAEEARLLESMLYELRMRYVKRAGASKA